MSTKMVIDYHREGNGGFQLYRECFDDEATGPIYLAFDGVAFTADSRGSVVVEIPRSWAEKLGLVRVEPPPQPG